MGSAALAIAVAAALGVLVVPAVTGGSSSTPAEKAVELAPQPWAGHSKPEYRSEESLQRAAPWDVPSKRTAPGKIDPTTGLPAASAGTNGSFTPPPPSERRRVYSATHPVGGVPSALLINRTALAPPSAPDAIKQMIAAANLIVGQPYRSAAAMARGGRGATTAPGR